MPSAPESITPRIGLATVLLAVALVATYFPSMRNGPVWDDKYLIVENPYLRSLDGLTTLWQTDLWSASDKAERSSFYRPLTMTTYWLNTQITGIEPWSIRAGNLLVHLLNAVLLFRLLTAILPSRHALLSIVFVAVWALAPLCSEPVIWLSGRFDLLVGLFALLALTLNRERSFWRSAGVATAVGLGLLCKENFLGWTPLLLIDDFVVHRRHVRAVAGKYLAIAGVVAAYLGLRAYLDLKSVSILADHDPETLLEAFLFAVDLFLSLLIAPFRLDPFHPYTGLTMARLIVSGTLLLALTVLLSARGIRRDARTGERLELSGWLWFLGGLLPSALTGPTLMMIGDRYAYLPLIGLFVALWPLVVSLEVRLERRGVHLTIAFLAAVAMAESWVTVGRSQDWRDDRSLAEASLRSHPNGFYALYTLGTMAAQEGDLDRASELLSRSLVANDGSWRTWNAVCYVLLEQDRLDDARDACLTSARINPMNPRVWVNLASVYVKMQHWNQAYAAAERSVAIKPHYINARYLAAVSAANLGQYQLAREHLEAGLAVDPHNPRLSALKAALEKTSPSGRSSLSPPPQSDRVTPRD